MWSNDEKNGEGTFLYNTLDIYKGNWINSKKNGVGLYIFANGD